jgi:DHA1 family bicyclomycin/chloramphenicol resistance-like MFS transporter
MENSVWSKKQNFFVILMIGALNSITPFSIDMYLPAFPQVAHDLHTTITKVALSLSTYFLGFALGQLIYGPLLDRFGRKRPLYVGIILYIMTTIGCPFSGTIETLLVLRFIEALSGCVASIAALAMVRDFFPVNQSARIISLMVLILGASPLLAPTVGAIIAEAWGWHFIFVILAAIALILLIVAILFLPEGHIPDKTISLKPKPILQGFKVVLFNPTFIVFALSGTLSFSGLFVYLAGSPSIFMDFFHLDPRVYGGLFALLSIGFIGGSQLNHLLTRKFDTRKIFSTTLFFQVILSALFLIFALTVPKNLLATISFLFCLLLCCGLSYPNAAAIALSPFSRNVGTASALLGFIQIGIGGFLSSGISALRFHGCSATALIMTFTSVTALIILFLKKSKQIKKYGLG